MLKKKEPLYFLYIFTKMFQSLWLHCTLAAVQCIIIDPVCVYVFVAVFVSLLPR